MTAVGADDEAAPLLPSSTEVAEAVGCASALWESVAAPLLAVAVAPPFASVAVAVAAAVSVFPAPPVPVPAAAVVLPEPTLLPAAGSVPLPAVALFPLPVVPWSAAELVGMAWLAVGDTPAAEVVGAAAAVLEAS